MKKVKVREAFRSRFKKYEFNVKNPNDLFIDNETCQVSYQGMIDIGVFEWIEEKSLEEKIIKEIDTASTISECKKEFNIRGVALSNTIAEIAKEHLLKVFEKASKDWEPMNEGDCSCPTYEQFIREALENA